MKAQKIERENKKKIGIVTFTLIIVRSLQLKLQPNLFRLSRIINAL